MRAMISRGVSIRSEKWVEGYYVCLNGKEHRIYSGYAETDRIIETIERRLRRIYKRAAKEAEEKANAYFEGFKQRDAAKLREVNAGMLSKREYGKWRKNQMLVGERWKEMRDNLAKSYFAEVLDDLIHAEDAVNAVPAADVVEVRHGENIGEDYDAVDQFVCSECGIELQGWYRMERDSDGEVTYHVYVFRFCPNCGAKMDKEVK